MNDSTFDKLSAINAELIAYVKWVLEKEDLDAGSRLIPIVDRFTVALVQARGRRSKAVLCELHDSLYSVTRRKNEGGEMRNTSAPVLFGFFVALVSSSSAAQAKWNFPDRKAIILDICPHIKITSFSFENTLEGRVSSSRNTFSYQWKNAAMLPVLAFEIVTLKYDPFDEPMTGARILVSGKNSADFSPLQPGESSGDGTIGYGHTSVLTAIAYVRAVRFTDGTLWRADPTTIAAEV